MQRAPFVGALGAALAIAAACSSAPRDHFVPSNAPETSPSGAADPVLVEDRAVFRGARWTGVIGANDPLELDTALRLALETNPDLSLQAPRSDAAAGQIEQASLRPSPTLALEVEDVLGSGPYRDAVVNQTTLYVNQEIELGAKRSRRMRLAEERSRALSHEHEVERIEVQRRTAHAFLQVARAQEELRFADELLQMQKDLEAAQAEQIRAGRTPESEVERSRAAVALALVQQTQTHGELDRARRELAIHFGRTELDFAAVVVPTEVSRELPDLAELELRVASNATSRLEEARVATSAAAVGHQRAERVPALEVSAGFRRFEETDDYAFTFGLSIPLTVTNANRGNILTAEAERRGAERHRRMMSDRLLSELQTIHGRLATALAEVETLEETVLPAAERSFANSEDGYRLGSFSYLELRQAQDTLIAARRQLADARIRYHEARVDLAALTDGFPLE